MYTFLPIPNSIYSQKIDKKKIIIKILSLLDIFIYRKTDIASVVIDRPPKKCINMSALG
jgi:hypothetical protein